MSVYQCSACDNKVEHRRLWGDADPPRFCAQCGGNMVDATPPPYVGTPAGAGVFRIAFAPVEAEFHSKGSAESAAYHSAWGEDREFGEFSVEKVRSTVPASAFPYVCADPECEGYVSKTDQGRCSCCGAVAWKLREGAPQKKAP